jgi:type IV pilus assembly protein PilF
MTRSYCFHFFVLVLVVTSMAGGLVGCVSSSVAPSAKSSDMLTSSDEPESRRRARIRLELAVGYYNNGQTTIALDEIKQSINVDANLFEAHNLRGLIYMRLNDLALAEESFKKALDLNPKAATVQHNYGWMMCKQGRVAESIQMFTAALANPLYTDRAKTLMTQGLCQLESGQRKEAEANLLRSYEIDPSNPIVAYNLALIFFQNGEYSRSQIYLRRLNNSQLANAESLWLGVKLERKLDNMGSVVQLGEQLKKRFPHAKETISFERSAFNE